MEINLENNQKLTVPFPKWSLHIRLGRLNGRVCHLTHRDKSVLDIVRWGNFLTVSVLFNFRPMPVLLRAEVQDDMEIVLCNTQNRVALYAGGELADEDWPVGSVPLDGAVCDFLNAEGYFTEACMPERESRAETFTQMNGYRPKGWHAHAGDCMPYFHNGTYHLFYLFDRRGHCSKWGLGAHQWAHVSTRDFKSWQTHPMALRIDRQEEGSICTGSFIYHNGLYYAFYAVRMYDSSPAQITWAVSEDCVHFEKTGKSFVLTEPYHTVSGRDPKVFQAADGRFHMMITTSILRDGSYQGCLAHYVSEDLENWTALRPMVCVDTEHQPECSDYFFCNGFYYLIYSLRGAAYYFYSREPFGPWTAPAENVVVDTEFRVPKAAPGPDGRMIFAGFRPDPDVNYGGAIRLYSALPQDDGTLQFCEV